MKGETFDTRQILAEAHKAIILEEYGHQMKQLAERAKAMPYPANVIVMTAQSPTIAWMLSAEYKARLSKVFGDEKTRTTNN